MDEFFTKEARLKKILMFTLMAAVLLGLSPFAHGAGFLIYEHGAAAMAMGGAFVALANDASAVFHNPAGIAWLDGTQISLGTTLIMPKGSLSLPNWPDPNYQSVDQEGQLFYPSTVYITHKLNDRITAGFGFFTPYGLGTKWPKDYPLRYIATSDDMKTFIFNPAISYKLNENFALAVGVSYIHSTLNFELVELVDLTGYGLGSYDMPAILDASGNGWGLNAGALYKGEKFSFGLNWRGGFKIKYEGDLELDTSNIPIPGFPTEGDASTAFNFPHILGAGIAFDLSENLILSADVHYVLWSCYDKFVVEIDVPGFEDKEVEEKWEDSFVIRGGFQYTLSESFALRAGILYDQTPQPIETMDPILPDANRWAFTGGFGYKSGNFVLDVAYQLELFNDRTCPNRDIYLIPGLINLGEGTYSTTAHLIGISFGFVF